MTSDIWPKPPHDDGRCFCYHPAEAHDNGEGFCSWESYGEACNCHRYRNLAAIRKDRREENFWASVGGHEW